ncbi:carbohydrate kinase family protein [Neobittarella massiliensis]|uniref:carbohydrate kinase family protein n=1 Tax=Neobittarella massiliensis (ex Bilen et al. 2018) TaxID=2041842 RepID=UPI0013EC57E0|nr:carbohydrate kinase family protein [Neobittarella massiliensis]
MSAPGSVLCLGDYHADIILQAAAAPAVDAALLADIAQGRPVPGITYASGGVGGSVCAAIARLGVPARPLGVVGDDFLGRYARQVLAPLGVDTTYLHTDPHRRTMMVLCHIAGDGERSFSYGFPMEQAADVFFYPQHAPDSALAGAAALYVSGIQLIFSPGCDTAIELMERCRSRGIPVAMDLNLRPDNFALDDALQKRYRRAIDLCDIVFGSGEEELMPLTGAATPLAAARQLAARAKVAVCKLGAQGALVCSPNGGYRLAGYPAQVADTVGAGDTFVGGFLARYVQDGDLAGSLQWGCAAGSYSVRFTGAGHSPDRSQMSALLAENSHILPQTLPL